MDLLVDEVENLVDEAAGVGYALAFEADEDARPVVEGDLTDDDLLEPPHSRVEVTEPRELRLFDAVVEPLEHEVFRDFLELGLGELLLEGSAL